MSTEYVDDVPSPPAVSKRCNFPLMVPLLELHVRSPALCTRATIASTVVTATKAIVTPPCPPALVLGPNNKYLDPESLGVQVSDGSRVARIPNGAPMLIKIGGRVLPQRIHCDYVCHTQRFL
jgi:hypothetical protein